MKTIEVIANYRDTKLNKRSPQFLEGFNECFELMELSLKHEGLYNQGLLFKQIKELQDQLADSKSKENAWKESLNLKNIAINGLHHQIETLKIVKMVGEPTKESKREGTLRKYQLFININNLKDKFDEFCNIVHNNSATYTKK